LGKEEYCGKWRYALTKRLRQAIATIDVEITLFKLSSEKKKGKWSLCGTDWLSRDCPFLARKGNTRVCFAPSNKSIRGCYILPYCKRGQVQYLILRSWKLKVKDWIVRNR